MIEIIGEGNNPSELWLHDDPKYNLCIHLSCLNTSEDETFGSIMIQEIDGVETLVGVGWNMNVNGITNMKRQGYSNHAEFQSLMLANALEYDVSNPNIPTKIYSGGRLIKSKLLFLYPDGQPFCCTKCASSIRKINRHIHLATPSAKYGWVDTSLPQASRSAEKFKSKKIRRDESMDCAVPISSLNISETQKRMDEIVSQIENEGIVIDEFVKEIIFNQYEFLLRLPIQERRAYIENIFGSLS